MTSEKWSCNKVGHEFFRVSDDRVCCSKCGEFRDAVTFAAVPYYVPVPYPQPVYPYVPWYTFTVMDIGTVDIPDVGAAAASTTVVVS